MRILKPLLMVVLVVAFGCGKDDPPKPPGKSMLLSPAKNTECSPIERSSGRTNTVQFTWAESSDTESYQVQVKNLSTGLTQLKTTTALSEVIPIAKGTAFSWSVVSSNTKVTETTSSDVWFFYSPGTEENYAPFPVEVLSPNNAKAFLNDRGEVTLEWKGSDLDNDIVGYELYFGTEDPPEFQASLGINQTKMNVPVLKDTVYYWRVVTLDAEDNSSDTLVLNFTAR